MADSSSGKHAGQGKLTEDDPFAELTRIMGHQPGEVQSSASETPETQHQDDLALDLEQELMGGFSQDRGEQPGVPDEPNEQQDISETPAPDAALPQEEPASTLPEPEQGAPAPEQEMPEGSLAAELSQALTFESLPTAPSESPHEEQEHAVDSGQSFAAGELPTEAPSADHDSGAAVPDDPGVPVFTDFKPLPPDPSSSDSREDQPQTEAFGSSAAEAEELTEPESEHPAEDANVHDLAQDLRFAAFEPVHSGFAEPQQESHPVPEAEDTKTTPEDMSQPADLTSLLSAEELAAGLTELHTEELTAPGELAGDTPHATEDMQPDISAHEARQFELAPEIDGGDHSNASASAVEPLPPEIQTVDVPEKPVTLAENLDIPDVHYGEKQPVRQYDEIEEILAGAFGGPLATDDQPSGDQTGEKSQAGGTQPDEEHEDHYDLSGIAAAGVIGGGAAAGFAAAREDAPSENALHGNWADAHGWDNEHKAPLTPEPGVSPPVHSGGSRWGSRLVVAGCVVGAIAILGGVTVYALNFGDDGGSGPIRIAADNSPVKVKPEDPGGVQIPNQDNQVYKRVSGEDSDAQPTQANLVSTTEDPMDLPAATDGNEPAGNTDTADPLPGVGDTVGLAPPADGTDAPSSSDSAQSDGSAPSAAAQGESGSSVDGSGETETKVQDRLASADSEASGGTGTNDDVISLAPRRVRSLVVRADGTMVPNDLPQGANSADEQANASATAEADSDSGVTIPDTGPIPPSRPARVASVQESTQNTANPARTTEPQEAEPQQQPQQNTAAVSPQPAASKWSVQIASQPTVEGAQQSYQTLAQRFGNVLQGKGVNIVKAEIDGRGTFYRVRIPSTSKEDAIQLCSELKSAGGSCFVSQ